MSCSYRLVRPTLALLLLLLGATSGCGQKVVFPRLEFKSSEPQTPSIPLSVRLDLPDALIYFEDLEVGAETDFGSYEVTREEVLEFARKYDPQPFHLSDEEAAKTHFGRLSASGWQNK